MIEVVGVQFAQTKKIYYFDPQKVKYQKEDKVIVETVNGIDLATVIYSNKKVEEQDVVLPLKQIIRLVNEKDKALIRKKLRLEKEAPHIFQRLVKAENLEMKFVGFNVTLDFRYVLFYYTAEDRVDFRQLVKKFAQVYHARIELRQINSREKASMIGGVGPCGYELCCSTFLTDLYGTTIKMAKNQRLSLISERISGLCDKLLCCLRYEDDIYTELARELPDVYDTIQTEDGIGRVVYINCLKQEVDVVFDSDGVISKKKYVYDDVRKKLLKL